MRAIIVAHFDRDRQLASYVLDALKQYRQISDHVVLSSPSLEKLPDVAQPFVDSFVARENIGYDFCSWRDGLRTITHPDQFDEIIFVNDSVYGPLVSLEPMLSHFSEEQCDMWGMVMSTQSPKRSGPRFTPHIQSWFYAMRKRILSSDSFVRFWNSVEPQPTKDDVIQKYEIGMSTHFLKDGFRLAGVFDARVQSPVNWGEIGRNLQWWPLANAKRSLTHLRKTLKAGKSYNPSELLWERLLDLGVPYVKASLFRVNHYRLNVERIIDGIEHRCDYDTAMMVEHLNRMGVAIEASKS